MAEEPQGCPIKVLAQEGRGLSSGHLGEEWDDTEADKDILWMSLKSSAGVDELHWVLHTVWRISQVPSEQTSHILG
jgi:hypothetical protein